MFGKIYRLPFVGEIFYCRGQFGSTKGSERLVVCYRNTSSLCPVVPWLVCGNETSIIGEYTETNLITAICALGFNEQNCYFPESCNDHEPEFVR